MKPPAAGIVLFWIVVIVAPALACCISAAQFPPDAEIPLHWNISGQIDRWGSPWTMLPVSLIMCGANMLMGLSYLFSDKLYDLGLVHGVRNGSVLGVGHGGDTCCMDYKRKSCTLIKYRSKFDYCGYRIRTIIS